MGLTAQRLREVVHYDPETGVFVAIIRRGGVLGKTKYVGRFDSLEDAAQARAMAESIFHPTNPRREATHERA